MKRYLKIGGIALAIALWGVGPAVATYTVFNNNIGTSAVDSRTIANHSISYIDLARDVYSHTQTHAVIPGRTVRGAIGGDFPAIPAGPSTDCPNNCSWAGYASLPFPATHVLTDDDVIVTDSTWVSGDVGQTKPVLSATEAAAKSDCTGTAQNPTAPPGVVCIYILGGDNAADVNGYSIVPGSGGSKYGFKLHWVSEGAGTANNTFIDAVWAYTADA